MNLHWLRSAALLSALVAQASITGCSSSSSPGSPDAGEDAGADVDGAAQSCDASVLPAPDAGGRCNACVKTSCTTQLAACASDCVCGPVEACLELSFRNNVPGCGGLGPIQSGEAALMAILGCVATNCGGPCSSSSGDAGGD